MTACAIAGVASAVAATIAAPINAIFIENSRSDDTKTS
jgi:hypothetical protein